ncbi:Glutathione S-transferase [Phaeobacter piscinae]|uniref:Glutathione S-transferase n=1 Tax=Phaeobacter piscinae TaxID=1580596 RepID=A0AAN1GSK0_9RHOB|nr:glutathione S-transferase [Phaeobacter piscinae]ATG44361.1 Glutathione S-transferase [Phaeobacter piscinae]AUR36675.1 Glutathione S-transferase [Phaeobacter piscinae]
MTYQLYIGDRKYSSWSLRGWLMLEKFNLPHEVSLIEMFAGTMKAQMAALAPARLLPTLQLPDGTVIGETAAIAETLAERHPEAGMWPEDPRQRATARWLVAEMASGFGALRSACPMQLAHVYQGFEPSDAVLADLRRVEALFDHARTVSGCAEGWLFGSYSIADAFYAPVAARIVGFDLPVSEAMRAYCRVTLSDPVLRRWRDRMDEVSYASDPYPIDLPRKPWQLS